MILSNKLKFILDLENLIVDSLVIVWADYMLLLLVYWLFGFYLCLFLNDHNALGSLFFMTDNI